jgi:hypothetical protein
MQDPVVVTVNLNFMLHTGEITESRFQSTEFFLHHVELIDPMFKVVEQVCHPNQST